MLCIMGWGWVWKQTADSLQWHKHELGVDLEQQRNTLPSWVLGRQPQRPTARKKHIQIMKRSKCLVSGWGRGDLTEVIYDKWTEWKLKFFLCETKPNQGKMETSPNLFSDSDQMNRTANVTTRYVIPVNTLWLITHIIQAFVSFLLVIIKCIVFIFKASLCSSSPV